MLGARRLPGGHYRISEEDIAALWASTRREEPRRAPPAPPGSAPRRTPLRAEPSAVLARECVEPGSYDLSLSTLAALRERVARTGA